MTDDIRFERHGALGVVILDRQRALNALTHAMVRALSAQLARWRDDDGIGAVLVKPAPGRAFCAGGDIVAVTELVRTGGVAAAVPFFHDEYRLNWRIHTYPKPYVALLDGITMGGEVGISVHGDFRIATDRTQFAMPETGIGFFPDVGGTWFLPRCPGAVGMYLGLTGARLNGADSVDAGVATHGVPVARLAGIEAELAECAAASDAHDAIAECLGRREEDLGERTLRALRDPIDHCFAGDTLAAVIERLTHERGGFGVTQLDVLGAKSPFALSLTFAQLRHGQELSIEGALRLEYRMVHRVLSVDDFVEGVRVLLIEKDRQPRWRYRTPDEVPEAEVAACMAPLPVDELTFDWCGI